MSKQNLLLSGVKRTPVIRTRLAEKDAIRFMQECGSSRKTGTELAREAICFYLDHKDNAKNSERDSILEKRLRKMEERMASLMARTAIDVGMVFHIMYRNMGQDKREDVVAWAYNSSIARLKKKLEGQAAEIKERMQKPNDKDSSKT